ncbi:MAG TPA: MtrB/PioB family outer membrane beta-barrel protein [Lacunisphaera sp.]
MRAAPICLVAGLLTPSAFTAPLADSATGTGTVLGNATNPAPNPSLPQDSDWATAKHTPTGQLFRIPFAVPKLEDVKKIGSDWEYSGQLEVGVIKGDDDERNAQYRMYQDVENDAYVNNLSLQLKKTGTGYFADLTAGGVGHDDQYYGLQFGNYNDWKVKIFFSETPHTFTDSYKSLWTGVGTGNLTLLPGLTPGGTASTATDNANVTAVATSVAPSTLSLTRKKGGIRIEKTISDTWKAYLSYSQERREGARPFGAIWGNNPGTVPIEIPEPIDYTTHDILAGVQHADTLNLFNLRLSASIFDNNIDTLTFQVPYRIDPPGGITTVPAAGAYTQGRFDLTPSNQAYNGRIEYTRLMPDFYKGSFTIVVSDGTWRQNDKLIPYTDIPNINIANVMLLDGGAWDTTGSLSRPTADTRIDTYLVDLTLSLNPIPDLNVKGNARYYAVENKTPSFLAVNPNAIYIDTDAATPGNQSGGLTLNGVTGVWGRPINDGSGQSILLGTNATPAGNIPIQSNLYSSEQFRFGPTADYTLTGTSTLSATAEREIINREHRERARTWEDTYKLGYVNRGLGNTTVRASYEYDVRRGSKYITNYYDDVLSSALEPMPTAPGSDVTSWAVRNNGGFRTLDLADRNQSIANLRVDTMVRSDLDAGVSFQAKRSTYPDSSYGRTASDLNSVNVDLSYQPSPHRSIYTFYSYQQGRIEQASIAASFSPVIIGQTTPLGVITPDNAAELGSAPGGVYYPLANAWTATSTDRNHVLGVGVKQEIGRATLNVDYSYTIARTRIEYTYTTGGAISAANAVFAGSRLPDMATDVNYLDATLRFQLTERLSCRFVYRYQRENIRDWHYQNLESTPVVTASPASLPTAVILDGGPQNYNVNRYGVILQIKF